MLVETVELFLIKTYLPRAIFIIVLWKLSSISVSLLGKIYRECKFTFNACSQVHDGPAKITHIQKTRICRIRSGLKVG